MTYNRTKNRCQEWRDENGRYHREDGPAFIGPTPNRTDDKWEIWYKHGEYHRGDELPAQTFINEDINDKEWWVDGERHREDGPALIRNVHGNIHQEWYRKGKLHNLLGPAKIYSGGTKKWYVFGVLHRLDGPAIERPDGTCECWEFGVKCETAEELNERMELHYETHRQAELDRAVAVLSKKSVVLDRVNWKREGF